MSRSMDFEPTWPGASLSFLDELLDDLLTRGRRGSGTGRGGALGIVRTSVPPLLDEALNGISFGTEIPLPAPV